MRSPRSIAEWLRLAYAGREECPPPELFLEAEWAGLADDERERVRRHLAVCPACAAERDLAAAYEAPPIPDPNAEKALARLFARLGGESRGGSAIPRRSAGRILPFRLRRQLLALAAAALVAVSTAVLLLYRGGAPPLPDPPASDVLRGARVVPVAPLGEVPAPPATFRWREVEGAVSYRLTLSAVDDAVLWSGTAVGASLSPPAAVRERLDQRVVYFWRVEALDADGARLAGSEPARFRWIAAPESGLGPEDRE